MASSLTKDAAGNPGSQKTFFGHPRGLATLFLTEMWERFSYYGMRALLPLYLVAPAGLGLDVPTATAITSLYMALVYLLALPGGWFGDRYWGPRKTVAIAAGIVMAGHLSLALPGTVMFYFGLLLVALGSGLLKANISTMVGHLYDGPNDPRRDGGFTVFYMGINIGAFVAPLVIGTVGQNVGWHWGFGLAALGMGLGLLQFLAFGRDLSPRSSQVPKPLTASERTAVLRKGLIWLLIAAVFYGIVGVSGSFTLSWVTIPLIILGLVIPIAVLARMKRDKELTGAEQSKLTAYLWFFAAAAIFWMIYDQGATTLALFADDKVDNQVLGWEFPVSWFQSVNPVLVMALAPVFAWIWLYLNRKGKEPSTIAKFAGGLMLVGISFFVFLLPLTDSSGGALVSPWWLVVIYFFQTTAELMLSPVGLSVTTKMAPAKYASQMMGVWFLAVTAGDSVTGLLSEAGVDLNRTGVVALEAVLAFLAGVAIFMYRRKVKTLMGEIH
ncbi:MFS transporter [Streptomyces sp. CAI-21]|jgi:POT family proton-dependent oligopeptide transporter|uniref:MFS transporter n=2 Tax=Streptomyces TaxID=1883 RepID=A0AB37XEG9_9ACTN|nr:MULTISPECIES: oligopeptide:H+ symporter [Streptomyces]MBO1285888.1 MFS transporter [Streptomyces sampsonii]MYQ74932.1 MFS transporter [Streptomyces sp. SID4934]MYX52949.1 MFS transporter [Streptomyces sp. SID8385]MYX85567.1 MFS transporter [Streptomyces sp. SID4915]NUW09610.1 MFS transporter [Streptomyces sp. CAI-21]NVI31167.1 MFS transporter [Streptomyces sp. CAI-17]QLA56954.1 MFS transporter [Streptomyces violascens]BDH50992.1 MFS transporter [Streptomyces albus]